MRLVYAASALLLVGSACTVDADDVGNTNQAVEVDGGTDAGPSTPDLSLDANLNRLFETWRARNRPELDSCTAWNYGLDESQRMVFLTIAHRLNSSWLGPFSVSEYALYYPLFLEYVPDGLQPLDHVTELYAINGGHGPTPGVGDGSCGGADNNRLFVSIDHNLWLAFGLANASSGTVGSQGPLHDQWGNRYWSESEDPMGPHDPFTISDETAYGGPTGQSHFFLPRTNAEQTEYILPSEPQGVGPMNRPGVQGIDDPYMLEMDQDYNFWHDSNPLCDDFLEDYVDNHGTEGPEPIDTGWRPTGCGPPPPPPQGCASVSGQPASALIAAGSYSGSTPYGVLISNNFSASSPSWTPSNAGFSAGALNVRRLELDRLSGTAAWAATADGGWKNTAVWTGGTWEQALTKAQFEAAAGISFPTGWNVLHLVPSATMAGRVHALVEGVDTTQPLEKRYKTYALLSTDGGGSWSGFQVGQYSSSLTGGTGGPGVSIFPSRFDPGRVWLTTVSYNYAGCVWFTGCSTLWASTNGGASFTEQLGWRFPYKRISHPHVPASGGNSTGYRWREPVGSGDPVFESTADGFSTSYRPISTNPFVQVGLSWANHPRSAHSLLVEPHGCGGRLALISNGYALTSSNGGLTWVRKTDTALGNSDVAAAGNDANELIAATSYRWLYGLGTEAIKFSPDFGTTWTNKTGNLYNSITAQYKYVAITAVITKP